MSGWLQFAERTRHQSFFFPFTAPISLFTKMSLQSSTFTSQNYFVLADSHAKLLPQFTSTPTHQITVTSISGLKWVDDHQHHLSALHQLLSPTISHHVASSNAIMFLIGSNSLRVFPAARVLNHVQHIISTFRQQHPHLTSPQSISIVSTFPCGKPSNTFPTPTLLQQNINLYNHQLYNLSTQLKFTIADFQIHPQHLSPDQLHIHRRFSSLIPHNIFTYFDHLASSSLTSPAKVNCRSAEAVKLRNRHRHSKLAKQQTYFYISRTVTPPWTSKHVKTYLQDKQLPFAKVSPIRNNQLRIRFNNALTLQATDASLPQDIFSAEYFLQVFSS